MADVFTPEKRSQVMSRIRSKNTKPELRVRSALHALGYRFRIHVADLPGRPDVVLRRYQTVIDVKGCFWHGHHCLGGRRPGSNKAYWSAKLDANVRRDARNRRRLRRLGWNVKTIWECQVKRMSDEELAGTLQRFLPARLASARRAS